MGLFGLLSSGNIGNDASLEAVLAYLREVQPDAVLDCMCPVPEHMTARYGIPASRLHWHHEESRAGSGLVSLADKALRIGLGIAVDGWRTAVWVRGHAVVIVPGMGTLEASLPLRPWQTPYSMFLLCLFGRLFGTKVALVSVGADRINQPVTRWLFDMAARLAFYRSYRDEHSRETMRRRGLDTSGDRVFPDLAFAIPAPPEDPGDPQIVGVGVMTYRGSNDERHHADEIYDAYARTMKEFVRWLVDGERKVRLLVGDKTDEFAVHEILADHRQHRPDLEPGWVVAEPISSFDELTRAMAPVGTVVASRFHNVICALKLCKPTIALGYSQKNVELMTGTGMPEFYQFAGSLNLDLLVTQFNELQGRADQVRRSLAERNAAKSRSLQDQFALMSAVLFPGHELSATVPSMSARR